VQALPSLSSLEVFFRWTEIKRWPWEIDAAAEVGRVNVLFTSMSDDWDLGKETEMVTYVSPDGSCFQVVAEPKSRRESRGSVPCLGKVDSALGF
jgi:hypothetical protein